MYVQDLRKLISENCVFRLRDLYVDREVMRSILDEGASRIARRLAGDGRRHTSNNV